MLMNRHENAMAGHWNIGALKAKEGKEELELWKRNVLRKMKRQKHRNV